jgi:hypothetical protein
VIASAGTTQPATGSGSITEDAAPKPDGSPTASSEEPQPSPNTKGSATKPPPDSPIRADFYKDEWEAEKLRLLARDGSIIHANFYDNRQLGGVRAGRSVKADHVAGNDVRSADTVGQKKRQRSAARVTSVEMDHIEKLRSVFVPMTDHLRDAKEILERHRIVILHGPRGFGKGSAAIDLLQDRDEILEINPSVTAEELIDFSKQFPYGKSRRFIIESLSPATATALNGFAIRSISRQLAAKDSMLVLTVDSRISLSTDLSASVVSWSQRPGFADLVNGHLKYYIGQSGEVELESLANRYPISEIESAFSEREASLIDRFAQALIEGYRRQTPLDELLSHVGLDAQRRAEEWFAQDRTIAELSLLLAVTVLGGCTYSTVSRHAGRLEALLAEMSRIDLATVALDVQRPRTGRLHNVMAVSEPGFLMTEYGLSPCETVRLEDPWLASAILKIVWKDFDLIAQCLMAWLADAGGDPDPDVRHRVALAVGKLAESDFATIRREIYLQWATGSNLKAAKSVADSLGVAIWNDDVAPLVLGLIRQWARTSSNTDLQRTATRSYGGDVGLRFPAVAMDELFRLAVEADEELDWVILDSLRQLFLDGGNVHLSFASFVLENLVEWATSGIETPRTLALAHVVHLLRAVTRRGPGISQWTLLTAPDSVHPTATLIRSCLSDRGARPHTLRCLRDLLVMADTEKSMLPDLSKILLASVGPPEGQKEDRDRLTYYLELWSSGSKGCTSAAAIRSDLIGER